ncbi:MAG: DUF2199 domain-containing protein [Chitinophagaceae bacterium]
MAHQTSFICSCCGKEYNEWPSLAFDSPTSYHSLSEDYKANNAELNTDFCVICHPEQTDRFIRCVLIQKVNDRCDGLQYGLWVSLSENSFNDYRENYDNENYVTQYFGWLSNNIPGYHFDTAIPTTVITKTGNQRPEIVPHDDVDHPFVKDYYNGITIEEAERRINAMLQGLDGKNNQAVKKSKPWWKLW